jgi:hypothetical protein
MSTATAMRPTVHARVQPAVAPVRETHPRHIEIVATKAQRRARPKVMHALVTLGAMCVIFISQLLLSIAVSDGAYRIAALQQSQKDLSRVEDSLAEQLAVLDSPQNLVANAASLGMVIATDASYLRLADGAVLPAPTIGIRSGCATMCGMIGNELTKGMTPISVPVTSATAGTGAGTTAGAASGTGTGTTAPQAGHGTPTTPATPTGPTTDQLPAPVTR